MKRLAILGASGHGKVVADCAELCGWESITFFDEAWPTKTFLKHWSIQGGFDDLLHRVAEYEGVLVAIGNNATRMSILRMLLDTGAILPVLVHPSAVVSRHTQIGSGSVVLAGALINIDCSIGMGAIINTGATVDHDCVLGDAVHISPGAHLAGGVRVGNQSWIGIGSCVKQQVLVGASVTVGAGAAVVHDVRDADTVVGVPARSM